MEHTQYYWRDRDNREGFPSFYLHNYVDSRWGSHFVTTTATLHFCLLKRQ